jgi:LPS sulfotransferase NodH
MLESCGSELADVGELYEADYDFPHARGAPRLRYMLATTQRSGSNLLALSLWRSGGLGAPLEYMRAASIAALQRRLGASRAAYWQALQQRRTSPNGAFGFKAFGSHLKECGRDMPELLEVGLPVDRIIFLTREEKDCQAISLARATQTDAWTASTRPAAEASFDRDLITGCRRFIERQEDAWLRYFDRLKATPVFVTYESVVHEPDRTIQRVAQSFGVDLAACRRVNVPALRRQADDRSQEWLRRFRQSRLERRDSNRE